MISWIFLWQDGMTENHRRGEEMEQLFWIKTGIYSLLGASMEQGESPEPSWAALRGHSPTRHRDEPHWQYGDSRPGFGPPQELLQRAGTNTAQQMGNSPSWAITDCKWRQKDGSETTVKITLLEKKKINTNTKERGSEPETINSWDKELKVSVGGQPDPDWKTKLCFFCWQMTFYSKGQRSRRTPASMCGCQSCPWRKKEQQKAHRCFSTPSLPLPHLKGFSYSWKQEICAILCPVGHCHRNTLQHRSCCPAPRGLPPSRDRGLQRGALLLLSVLTAFTFHVVCLEAKGFVFEQLNFSVRCSLLASESLRYKCFAAAAL